LHDGPSTSLRTGTRKEFRQAFLRGGAEAPLSTTELEEKFMDNALYGGWTAASAERLLTASRQLFTQPTLDNLKEFRA
jgi:hypothetical protein